MSPERKRAKHSADKPESKQGSFEIALPIRIGIALVLVIISALFHNSRKTVFFSRASRFIYRSSCICDRLRNGSGCDGNHVSGFQVCA